MIHIIQDYGLPIVPGGHFNWREYAIQREWGRLLTPTEDQYKNAIFLFTKLENLIRKPLDKSLDISSGARSMEYTKHLRSIGIPAALKSAHIDWQAVDLKPPVGMTNKDFWHWCSQRWPGRMENLSATPTWVHLDTREWGKKVRFNP